MCVCIAKAEKLIDTGIITTTPTHSRWRRKRVLYGSRTRSNGVCVCGRIPNCVYGSFFEGKEGTARPASEPYLDCRDRGTKAKDLDDLCLIGVSRIEGIVGRTLYMRDLG